MIPETSIIKSFVLESVISLTFFQQNVLYRKLFAVSKLKGKIAMC